MQQLLDTYNVLVVVKHFSINLWVKGCSISLSTRFSFSALFHYSLFPLILLFSFSFSFFFWFVLCILNAFCLKYVAPLWLHLQLFCLFFVSYKCFLLKIRSTPVITFTAKSFLPTKKDHQTARIEFFYI